SDPSHFFERYVDLQVLHSFPTRRSSDLSELLLNSKSVGIIGTNLTSLDIIMYLKKHNYKNDIIVTSRSGTVPFIRGNEAEVNIDVDALKNKKDITIHDIVDIFKEKVKRKGIDFNIIKKLNEMSVIETLK